MDTTATIKDALEEMRKTGTAREATVLESTLKLIEQMKNQIAGLTEVNDQAKDVLAAMDARISDLREIKDGYCAAMIAWRRLAEQGIPLEQSLSRKRPAPLESADSAVSMRRKKLH